MTASLFPASHRTKLILILLIGMTLRFSFLGSKSLWFDEAFTAVYSLNPIPTLLLRGGERPETHPPLYYIGIHYWIQAAGDSETALRLPSALASTVSLVLLYLLGRRLFNPKIGLMAMALLAVAPIDIWYAQEARMYAFMATFGLLMALALLWERWWAIGLLTITLTLGIYFNYVMFPIWAGLSGLWLAYWWKDGKHLQPIITWAVASVLAWLLYIPWLPKLIETLVISNRVQLFIDLRNKLHFPYLSPEQYLWLLPLAGLIIWLGATLFLHLLRHQTNKKGVYWIVLSAFLILTLLSPLPRLYSIKRVLFAPSWPFFALLAAWVIHHLQVRQRQIWRGVILLSFLASLVGFAVPKDDWRGVATYLNQNVAGADAASETAVWIAPPWNRIAYSYYKPKNLAQSGNLNALTALNPSNVWLITERFPNQTPPTSEIERWLDENRHLVEAVPFYRLELRHYSEQ